MIKAGSDFEILNVLFDVKCTLKQILYNKQPDSQSRCHRFFLSNCPKNERKISNQLRLVQQTQLVIYSAQRTSSAHVEPTEAAP